MKRSFLLHGPQSKGILIEIVFAADDYFQQSACPKTIRSVNAKEGQCHSEDQRPYGLRATHGSMLVLRRLGSLRTQQRQKRIQTLLHLGLRNVR